MKAVLGSALFILGYNVTVLLAYRHVDAGRVTAAEYSGLLWAFVLGWLIFREVPDAWFWLGASLIAGPLMIQGLRASARQAGRRLPTAVGGSRRATDYLALEAETIKTDRLESDLDHACDESPAPAPSARCSAD